MALNEDHGLTEEEAAALELKDDEEETTHVDPDADPEAAAQPQASADEEGAAAPVADPDATPAAEPAAAAADPAPEAAPAAEPAAAKVEAAAPAPLFVAHAPEDAQAKLAQIAADKVALMDKFEAGEITTKEYQLGLDGLNDQQFDIKQAVSKAEIAREMSEQQINAQWVADCTTFLGSHPEYVAGSERRDLLDETIKSFVHRPSMKNVSNHVALEKAHRMVQAELGEVTPAAAPAGKTVVQHKIPTPAAPPNIGSLPAAAMNDTTGGEFANLDRLAKSDMEGYEAAIEKLTDAQRARYFKT